MRRTTAGEAIAQMHAIIDPLAAADTRNDARTATNAEVNAPVDESTPEPAKLVHLLPDYFTDKPICIDLVGVGGTGTQVLSGLASLHLALRALGHPYGLQVTAYDPDRVSTANIGRQLFAPSDVGQYKADVLIGRLNLYYGLDWAARCTVFGKKAEGGFTTDIVVSCVDTAKARREIGSYIHDRGQLAPAYWLDCGNSQHKGQVFLTEPRVKDRESADVRLPYRSRMLTNGNWTAFGPRHGKRLTREESAYLPPLHLHLKEIFDENIPEDNRPSCSLAEALQEQGLFINRHVALWALTLLEGLLRNKRLEICGYWINLDSGSVATVPICEAEALMDPKKRARRCRKGATNG